MIWLAVALGSALGAVIRHACRLADERLLGLSFAAVPLPVTTLFVNLTGSFAIGAFAARYWSRQAPPEWEAFFVIGLLGGFTTFSAFSRETVGLAVSGQTALAASHVLLGTFLPLAGAFAGFYLAR